MSEGAVTSYYHMMTIDDLIAQRENPTFGLDTKVRLECEIMVRSAIRNEILQIAEEIAEEEEAAEHREEAERTHRLAARMANAADDPMTSYYGTLAGSFKLI